MPSAILVKRASLAIAMVIAFFLLQDLITILHEHAHSTAAWALGYTPTPFTVVWGHWIIPTGWDEGVPYDRLFPAPGNISEAVIGGIPLLMHVAFLWICFYTLVRLIPDKRPVLYFLAYLFTLINIAELIAYFVMRPFIPNGDTGRFNEGTGLSPWILFIFGAAFDIFALRFLATKIGPKLEALTGGSRLVHWLFVLSTAFILFLWGSGLRMFSLYPDPQWKVGFVGVAAFFGWILADVLWHPALRRSAVNVQVCDLP